MKSKARLELVGRLPRKPGNAVGHLAVHGKLVYLVNEDGLQLVDVSDPAARKLRGTYKPEEYLGPVAASGDFVYVVEKDNRLRVLDACATRSTLRAPGGSSLTSTEAATGAGKDGASVIDISSAPDCVKNRYFRASNSSSPALPLAADASAATRISGINGEGSARIRAVCYGENDEEFRSLFSWITVVGYPERGGDDPLVPSASASI